jgi:hypothetical protein
MFARPGLLGSPGLVFPTQGRFPKTVIEHVECADANLPVADGLDAAVQNAGRATCQRLAPSNPLMSPGA